MRILGILAAISVMSPVLAQPARDNPYMKYTDRQEWQSQIRLRLDAQTRQNARSVRLEEFEFESAIVMLPTLKGTGSSLAHSEGVRTLAQVRKQTGPIEFKLVGDVDETTDLLPSGARFARIDLPKVSGVTQLELIIDSAHSLFATEFNEAEARKLDWPSSWPPEALAARKEEAYVSHSTDGTDQREAVRKLLERFVNGEDPQSIKPVDLAKFLTAEFLFWFQVEGRNSLRTSDRTVQPAGAFNPSIITSYPVRPAGEAAANGRGTPADLVTLWTALMREAGLPARIVIGYDLGEEISQRRAEVGYLEQEPGIRLWAEFALYDAERDILTWVPVDVPRLDAYSSSKRNWQEPWLYFGTHEQLSSIIPLAHHWVPPVPSESYGPALWGWTVLPEPPKAADQFVTFTGTSVQRELKSRPVRLEAASGLASSVAGPGQRK